jgi:predicted heme/steroid binding protein
MITERVVTPRELSQQNGDRGRRKYVAYRGVVYDVTDCPKWRTEMHEQLHWPGQDLSSELPEAPHDEAVFDRPCVKRIGILQTIT